MRYIPGNIKDYVTDIKFTSGAEYMYISGVEYKGYYHNISGTIYSGASHDEYSKILILYNSDKNYVEYINAHNFYLKENYSAPKPYFPVIKDSDYTNGYITRYFIRKRNDISAPIIEVDSKQYASLSKRNTGINESYYFGIKLKWKISGPKNDVYKNGNIVIYGIEDTNNRTLTLKEKEMSNIRGTLKFLTQFGRIIG